MITVSHISGKFTCKSFRTMYLFTLFFHNNFSKEKGLRMFNYNDNKNYIYNDASYHYNKSNQNGKKSPIEDDEIEIVGTRPVLDRNFS